MNRPVIYIDTLFFLNLIINYLLLLAAARLSSSRFSRGRLLLGAVLGALYAVAAVVPATAFMGHAAFKLAFACLITLTAFGRRPGCGFWRVLLMFIGVSFALGGGVLALYWLLGAPNDLNTLGGALYVHIDVKTLLLTAAGCYALFSLIFSAVSHLTAKRTVIEAKVTFLSREVAFTALVDTGNTLVDPLSNAPVLVVEYETIRAVLPNDLSAVLTKRVLRSAPDAMELAGALGYGRYFSLVPFHAVGVECGMLLGLRADRAELDGVKKNGMVIAISPNKLSDGAGYTALSGAVGA